MKLNYIILVVILGVTWPVFSFAQEKAPSKPNVWDRMYVGGNLGLQFGDITDIEVSPHVGYYIYPRWSMGIGGTYEYYKSKAYLNIYAPNMNTHIYGWNIFTELALIPDLGKLIRVGSNVSINGYMEYERLSLEKQYFEIPYNSTGRFWIDNFMVGGGLKEAVGRRSNIYFLILWNLNETINSLYSNPVFKFGFNF